MRKVLYILGELSDTDVEWMIDAGKHSRCSEGTVLVHEGDTIEALYILLEGQLAVSAKAQSSERDLGRMGMGAMVGEVSFVDNRPTTATVKASSDALLLSIPRAVLRRKLESDAGFAARFYRAVAMSLAYHLRDMVALLTMSPDGNPTPEHEREEDKLGLEVLDTVYLAGQRFDRILRRLAAEDPRDK